MFWTRLALWSVLGLVLDALGLPFTETGFWLIVGLFFALDIIARIEAREFLDDLEAQLKRIRQQQLERTDNDNSNSN